MRRNSHNSLLTWAYALLNGARWYILVTVLMIAVNVTAEKEGNHLLKMYAMEEKFDNAERDYQDLMDTTYNYMEQQERLDQRRMMNLFAGAVIVVLILLLVEFVYYNRKVRKQNKLLTTLFNGMEAYRYMLDKNENESAAKNEQLPQEVHTSERDEDVSEEGQALNPVEEKENDLEALQRYKLSEDDKQLFVLMDRLVVRDKLFLNPDLSREDLMNLIGIDKNRFGKMMSHYSTASNASSYISAKRAEYAATLLRQHPEYTIAAIAEMCGMSNTVTLNRTFKQLYGVTPSKYRDDSSFRE